MSNPQHLHLPTTKNFTLQQTFSSFTAQSPRISKLQEVDTLTDLDNKENWSS